MFYFIVQLKDGKVKVVSKIVKEDMVYTYSYITRGKVRRRFSEEKVLMNQYGSDQFVSV